MVEKGLEILGWSEFSCDFAIRPNCQLGSKRNSLRPDFLIKSSETDEKLFVIEIKKPKTILIQQNQTQLSTYMRQFKLPFGLLIGPQIQIFYDGLLNPEDNAVLIETIEFKRGSSEGERFVQLFSKANFNLLALKEYAATYLKLVKRAADIQKLKQKITSEKFTLQIAFLIKQELSKDYNREMIDEVMQNIDIHVDIKKYLPVLNSIPDSGILKNTVSNLKNKGQHDSTRYILNGNGIKLAKNRFVLEFIREYIKRFPSEFRHLKEVFHDSLQGSTGVINSLELVNKKYAHTPKKRHFVQGNEILTSSDHIPFVVSTEWSIGNVQSIVRIAREKGFIVEELRN
ncbi:MAG: type I restriction enzyme HsdR N-terminal domain-containing protein [Bacteroidales bacterium]|nr:type I restriction enzyme HsdR N-terminal domain-containing protein [Bacteroidales bacterium]